MSSTSSKASKGRRSSILKVRQTVTDSTVEVVQQPNNRRRVSFHHQKAVKEYDKECHELSATSPLKESVKEAMSDFDSTKSNSTIMSLATPDRTTGDNQFRGLFGAHPSSTHHETTDMSISMLEDGQNDTLNMFNGAKPDHVTIHTKTVDISYQFDDTMNDTAAADNTMDLFRKPSRNMSTRTSNMTMEMDISQADNTLRDEAGDDTMGVFGESSKKNDTSVVVLDSTMDVFGAGTGSKNRSLVDQSVLMDITVTPTPPSSQNETLTVFGSVPQADESVAMEEATMEEGRPSDVLTTASTPSTPSTPSSSSTLTPLPSDPSTPIASTQSPSAMDASAHSANRSLVSRSMRSKDSQSPGMEDTMAVFGSGKTLEAGDEDVPMDITVQSKSPSSSQGSQLPSQDKTINIMRGRSSDDMEMSASVSPTMNVFKRKGDDDEENTMHVFRSKKTRDDTREEDEDEMAISRVETPEAHGSQKVDDMDEVDATMNVFGVKTDTTMDESTMMEEEMEKREEEEKEQSMMEMSAKTAIEGEEEEEDEEKEKTMDPASTTLNETLGMFNEKREGEKSEMDVSGVANTSNGRTMMGVSGEGDETLGVFVKKEEEGEGEEEEEREEEKEEEKSMQKPVETSTTTPNEKMDGSEEMDEETPSHSTIDYEERRKKRLSTVIEVSSRYTAASSQSMMQRVESTGEVEKEGGILDGMEMTVDEEKGEEMEEEEVKVEEEEEEKKEEKEEEMKEVETTEEQKSIRMEESMVDSPCSSTNNTTFSLSFSKRSILDETRLSDRSMMNITRSFDEMMLENINWMKKEEGEIEEIDGIMREHGQKLMEETRPEIERSESTVQEHLKSITEEHGDLLAASVSKLNPTKVNDMKQLFEWARREAQREWWEKRRDAADGLVEEMGRRMERDGKELEKAKDDVIMMNRLGELGEDVARLSREVSLGRGMSRSTIDEMIGASKRKEEEKEILRKKVAKMEMENVIQSTHALRMMTERCNAVDRSIREKMEERERNKKEMRAYLAQLTNNLN